MMHKVGFIGAHRRLIIVVMFYPNLLFDCNASTASTSSSSWTSNTRARLSRNELTATRSIRLVVAWYSMRRTVGPPESLASAVFRSRFTKEESSLSTRSAWRATEASRASGKGTSRAL